MLDDLDWVDAQRMRGIKPQCLRLRDRVKEYPDNRRQNSPLDPSFEFKAKDGDPFAVYVADSRRDPPEQIAGVAFRRLPEEIRVADRPGRRTRPVLGPEGGGAPGRRRGGPSAAGAAALPRNVIARPQNPRKTNRLLPLSRCIQSSTCRSSPDSEVGPRAPIESPPRDPELWDSRKQARRKTTSTDFGSGPGTGRYSRLSTTAFPRYSIHLRNRVLTDLCCCATGSLSRPPSLVHSC